MGDAAAMVAAFTIIALWAAFCVAIMRAVIGKYRQDARWRAKRSRQQTEKETDYE
jgi:hypothetical protein